MDRRGSDGANLHGMSMLACGALYGRHGIAAIITDPVDHLDPMQFSTLAIRMAMRASTETDLKDTE